MSRWTELFENHPFQTVWSDLKLALSNEKVDDQTVLTSVTELARLKKVITYLDVALQAIDPELIPIALWETFHSQCALCLTQLNQYTSNRNIGHIQNANAHADNLLSYVRPYMITSKSVGNVLQQAIKSYAKTIDEYGESFRNKSTTLVDEISNYKNQSEAEYKQIEETKNLIDQFNVELFGENETDDGIQHKVNKLVSDFETKHEEIEEFYNEIFIGHKTNISTIKQISQAKETISSDQSGIEEILENVSTEVNDLKAFHIKMFGNLSDDEETEGGLSGELSQRIKALGDFESKQAIKYQALNNQIESLLPGATSAGLATAYLEMKLSFNEPIKNASKVFYWSIAILIIASVILAVDSIGLYYINFVKFNDWTTVLRGLAYKVPFYAPILWLAFYATKRRSEYQRLQQEYAHKEALAKSYDSYKKQLEELDSEDKALLKAFIGKAIDAVAYNASTTLDVYMATRCQH